MNTHCPPLDPIEFEYLLQYTFEHLRHIGREHTAREPDVMKAAVNRYGNTKKAAFVFWRVMALQALVDSGLLTGRYYTPPAADKAAWIDDAVVHLAARFPVSVGETFDAAQFLSSLQKAKE